MSINILYERARESAPSEINPSIFADTSISIADITWYCCTRIVLDGLTASRAGSIFGIALAVGAGAGADPAERNPRAQSAVRSPESDRSAELQ